MNQPVDRELVQSVFADVAPADFEASVLTQTLAHARRQRVIRRTRRSLATVVALTVAVLGVWQIRRPRSLDAPITSDYTVVRTARLPSASLVSSVPFAGTVTNSPAPSYVLIQTGIDPARLRWLTDQELLTLAGPGRAALIRRSSNEQELVILPGKDSPQVR